LRAFSASCAPTTGNEADGMRRVFFGSCHALRHSRATRATLPELSSGAFLVCLPQ